MAKREEMGSLALPFFCVSEPAAEMINSEHSLLVSSLKYIFDAFMRGYILKQSSSDKTIFNHIMSF